MLDKLPFGMSSSAIGREFTVDKKCVLNKVSFNRNTPKTRLDID